MQIFTHCIYNLKKLSFSIYRLLSVYIKEERIRLENSALYRRA